MHGAGAVAGTQAGHIDGIIETTGMTVLMHVTYGTA